MFIYLVNRLKSLIFTVINLLKSVACIFHKRRRKQSGEFIMENVVVEKSSRIVPWEISNWDSVENSIESKIDAYRSSLIKIRANQTNETNLEPDFFNVSIFTANVHFIFLCQC